MLLQVGTSEPTEVVDVTDRIEATLPSGVESGACTVFVPHTTAGIAVNESETGLRSDVRAALSRLVPDEGEYRHDEIDDNATAHLRAMLLGSSVTVPITDGALALGNWQSILFVEADGPRDRRLRLVVSESVHA